MVKNATCLICLLLTLMLSGFESTVKAITVEVYDESGLISQIRQLQDGDTLLLSAGTFMIDSLNAPDGLIIASEDYTPYSNVTIMGAGKDSTIIDFNANYGFFAYYSDELLVRDLSIKNAKKNGGLYVQIGNVNLEKVLFENCENVIVDSKVTAYGGAVFYDTKSKFTYIRECDFVNNFATTSGGAIGFVNSNVLYPHQMTIERCRFQGNTATLTGAAVYFSGFYAYLYLENNAFYENVDVPAVFIDPQTNNSKARLYLTNNSLAYNYAGIEFGSNMRSYLYMNNNAIVSNTAFDLKSNHSSTKYKGNHNVVQVFSGNTEEFTGSYNNVIATDLSLFYLSNDSLKHNSAALPILAGRVPSSAKTDYDLYVDPTLTPADIGAINVPEEASVAVWTGNVDQDFSNAANWKYGVTPMSGVDYVIISNCTGETYPLNTQSIDLSGTDIYITPTGIFVNQGNLTLDSLMLLSLEGGSGQFLNEGTLNTQVQRRQVFLKRDVWTPLHVSYSGLAVNDLVEGASYGVDYEVNYYDEATASYIAPAGSDVFDVDRGYLVKSTANAVAEFPLVAPIESLPLQLTPSAGLSAGFNLIANPYNVPVGTRQLLDHNLDSLVGTVYVLENNRFKVWFDGFADEDAELISPAAAFFVHAMDNANLDFEVSDILIDEEPAPDTVVTDDKGVLKIELGSSSTYYDNAFLRFNDAATWSFDPFLDALKLDRLSGTSTSMLYLQPSQEEDTKYAISAQSFPEDSILSFPLVIDFASLSNSTTQSLRFTFSESDSIGYLLHDANKDSSESVVLNNNEVISFSTGEDVAALKERFSLQVFDGIVPEGVLNYGIIDTISKVEYLYTEEYDTILSEEITQFVEFTDTVYSGDTIFVYGVMGDSTYSTLTIDEYTITDLIHIDSFVVDTLKLLGTHEYHRLDTFVVADTFFIDRTKTDSSFSVQLDVSVYPVADTLVSTGLDDELSLSLMEVYASNGTVVVSSSRTEHLDVDIYDMSGRLIIKKAFPQGNGQIEILNQGIYIVKTEQNGDVFSQKIIIE